VIPPEVSILSGDTGRPWRAYFPALGRPLFTGICRCFSSLSGGWGGPAEFAGGLSIRWQSMLGRFFAVR
jgi:hypothetical protein